MRGRLDSWKEIAAYLGKGVRTVQRWEREEGLPVHRLAHAKRGTVYAHRHELDAWWNRRGASLRDVADDEPRAVAASRWRRALLAGGAFLIVLSVIVTLSMRMRDSAPSLSLHRVTSTTGLTVMPTLSPDGRLVAYASDGGQDGAALHIWVQQIGSPSAVKLTHGPGVHTAPSFSADSTRIVFTRSDGARSDLYEIPALGGEPRLLVPDGGIGHFSPDGQWLVYSGVGPPFGVHLATATGEPVRDLAAGLIAGRTAVWAPDSQRLLVLGRARSLTEVEAWVVPIDGSPPTETGLLRFLRERDFNTSWAPLPAWVAENELVFSGRNRDGWSLWRQRLAAGCRPTGEPERLTTGTALDWWPSFAAGRLVYVSSYPDSNLWSIPADTANGTIVGPLRRLTRGSGITAYPSLSTDGRLMAFASDRDGNWDIYLKDVPSGKERVLASGGDRQMYSVITPDGTRVAFGVVVSALRVRRPVYIADVASGAVREVCGDCNGRPRDWLFDGRQLVVERFSRLNSVAVVDAATATQRELLTVPDLSITDPRVSPDGQWIAFSAGRRERAPSIYVAPLRATEPVRQVEWVEIDREVNHPFWSPDGRLVYFVLGAGFGSQVIRARRFDPRAGRPVGDTFDVYRLEGGFVPGLITSGAGLVATSDQIVLTLADFRGDVWMTSVSDRR